MLQRLVDEQRVESIDLEAKACSFCMETSLRCLNVYICFIKVVSLIIVVCVLVLLNFVFLLLRVLIEFLKLFKTENYHFENSTRTSRKMKNFLDIFSLS